MIAALLACGAGGCSPSGTSAERTSSEEGEQPPASQRLLYTLIVDTDRLTIDQDGEGFEVVTDLGYLVRVDRLEVASYSAELLRCEPSEGEVALWQRAMELLIPPAHAGHDASISDTATRRGVLEAWHRHTSQRFDEREVSPAARYCQVHYLVARSDDRFEGVAPGDERLSLILEGNVLTPGGAAPQSLTLRSAINYGALFAIDEAQAAMSGTQAWIEISIRRAVAEVFDGVRFDELDDVATSRAIIQSIIEHTSIDVMVVEGD